MSPAQWLVLALVVPAVLIGAFLVGRGLVDDTRDVPGLVLETADDAEDADWFYVIPPGTAGRIAAGEPIEIVPAELEVVVGDTIRIVNDDTADHIVGVFFIGAGETLTQRFQTVGELAGECSVHPSGAFTLRVVDDRVEG